MNSDTKKTKSDLKFESFQNISKSTNRLILQLIRKKRHDMSCSICLESISKKVFHLPCGHVLHQNCLSNIITSFRGHYWYKCPVCRTNIIDSIMKISIYRLKVKNLFPDFYEHYYSHLYDD